MELTFRQVETQADIDAVVHIAGVVWPLAYDALLPPGQVAYMLEKYQSDRAVKEQMAHQNYRYDLALFDGVPGGFVGFSPRYEGREEMFLSKLYFLPEFRHKGGARAAVALVERAAQKEGLPSIRLTVNRGNTHAVEVYRALGFTVSTLAVTDIGGGYVMDDYIMVKKVTL